HQHEKESQKYTKEHHRRFSERGLLIYRSLKPDIDLIRDFINPNKKSIQDPDCKMSNLKSNTTTDSFPIKTNLPPRGTRSRSLINPNSTEGFSCFSSPSTTTSSFPSSTDRGGKGKSSLRF